MTGNSQKKGRDIYHPLKLASHLGMSEKKRQEKSNPLPGIKSSVTEVLVANGRSFQPFIRTFSYTGENISKSNLGTLIGIFEIDDISEDSAYIVNFLASVAKKEYWSNPRRGAIESFEAALHKINLALSELVKHGNVSWLGRLHGTIGVLEKNNFHFSVTGQAKILLLRNDGISDISTGLASEESRIHPIKTFVEVSSGRLMLDDRVILTSPELLALFSLEELAKNAKRMNRERFMQFLKTALVNELDMSGIILIDVSEEVITPLPKTSKRLSEEKSLENIQNIFSQSAFLDKKTNGTLSAQKSPEQSEEEISPEKAADYVDTKTGHIYVQGTALGEPGRHVRFERFFLTLQELFDMSHFFISAQGKWIRKGKKQLGGAVRTLSEESGLLKRKIGRTLRKQWRKRREALEKQKVADDTIAPSDFVPVPPIITSVSDIPLPKHDLNITKKETFPENHWENLGTQPSDNQLSEEPKTEELPLFIKEKLASFYRNKEKQTPEKPVTETSLFSKRLSALSDRISLSSFAESKKIYRLLESFAQYRKNISLGKRLKENGSQGIRFFRHLPKNTRFGILGFLGLVGCVVLVFLFLKPGKFVPDTTTVSQTENSPSTPPSNNETDSGDGEIALILDDMKETIIVPVILGNETYIITEKNILTVTDRKYFPIPGNNSVRFATVMDDLGLIFIFTETGKIYAWSPISKTFVENTLTLNEKTNVTGIDTYLTYLYVLDSGNDQIYRFPRANNGFGASTAWLKENTPIEETSRFSVNETIFIAADQAVIKGYFRGRETNTFETPTDGLNVTDLYAHPGLTHVYALDTPHKRILVWDQDGRLIRKFSHDTFSEGTALTVNEKTGEIFISTRNSLFSYTLR